MARSMVSIGTDESRAFWNMVRSVAFDSGSPPPSRAATSTWRMSLANSFPRALSCAPFLCLIVAHFEWPDIALPLVQELLMDAQVVGELRMERSDGDRALAAQDNGGINARQHLDALPHARHLRGPDEHRREPPAREPVDVEVGFERVDLTAERVAAHGDVDGGEATLVGAAVEDLGAEEDHPRARAQRRHPVPQP